MRYRLVGIMIVVGFIALMLLFSDIQHRNVSPTAWEPSSPALVAAVFVANACMPQPCWHGLRPGVTTREQAKAILVKDPGIANVTDGSVGFLNFDLLVKPGQSLSVMSQYFQDGILSYVVIQLPLSSGESALRLGDAVEYLGQPGTFHIENAYSNGYVLDYSDGITLFTGPDVTAGAKEGIRSITPDFLVSAIRFGDKARWNDPEPCVSPWQGFGDLQIRGCQ